MPTRDQEALNSNNTRLYRPQRLATLVDALKEFLLSLRLLLLCISNMVLQEIQIRRLVLYYFGYIKLSKRLATGFAEC